MNTLQELPEGTPYRCHLLLAVPWKTGRLAGWPDTREAIEREFTEFWAKFQPGIKCVGVEVRVTDRITLADIERYQRFDADWVSFEDESSVTPIEADLRA